MLNKGDVTVYGIHGLCKVSDILVPSFIDKGQEKLYYVMIAVTDKKGILYMPVDGSEDKVRDVVSADEAENLISGLDEIDDLDIPGGKKCEGLMFDIIKRNDAEEMMSLVKTLHRKRAERELEGKKFAAIDEKYLGMCEKILFSELAFSIGTDLEDISGRVYDELSRNEYETV